MDRVRDTRYRILLGITCDAVFDMFRGGGCGMYLVPGLFTRQRETLQAGRTRRLDKLSTEALCKLALRARLFARRSRRARG